ncbi:hypothetical protein FGG08_006124 [Glutinoglossum americanum]|uniref:Uncharacterized protein n=1 Tax=Glutinoglossum americanum TaxID=1670608 RepID=A0A9P8L169_9PEZI|nr:hypothetical protein FGG08_006124 [Glutinoglossum americanum]
MERGWRRLADDARLTHDDLEKQQDIVQRVEGYYASLDASLRCRAATDTLPWDLFPKLQDLPGHILTPSQEKKTRVILYATFKVWFSSLAKMPIQWLLKDMVIRMGKICLILEFIGARDLLDKFIEAGITDSDLPSKDEALKSVIVDDRLRVAFWAKQYYTTVRHLEDGCHSILRREEKLPLLERGSLGDGGHGVVDKVQNAFDGKTFARKKKLAGKNARLAFEREKANLPKLSHTHIVQFISSYQWGQEIGMLLQPVARCDLKAFLTEHQYSVDRPEILCRAFGCLPAALAYMHDKISLRHKDIKPRNILVDLSNGGNVLFTDFGISLDFSEGSSLTRSTEAYTYKYASPEIVDRQPRGKKSDVFSLGCVFFEMATVLAGEDLDKRETIFRSGGPNSSTGSEKEFYDNWGYHISTSTGEIGEWIKEQQEQADDNKLKMIFGWCGRMLKHNQEDRPSVRSLAVDIVKESSKFELRGKFICGACEIEVKKLERIPLHQNLLGDALPMTQGNQEAKGQVDVKDFAENMVRLTMQEGVSGSPAVVEVLTSFQQRRHRVWLEGDRGKLQSFDTLFKTFLLNLSEWFENVPAISKPTTPQAEPRNGGQQIGHEQEQRTHVSEDSGSTLDPGCNGIAGIALGADKSELTTDPDTVTGAGIQSTGVVPCELETLIPNITLEPNLEQWMSFDALMQEGKSLGGDKTGVFKVVVPPDAPGQRYEGTAMMYVGEAKRWRLEGLKTQVFSMVMTLEQHLFQLDQLSLEHEPSHSLSARQLLARFEDILQVSTRKETPPMSPLYATDLDASLPEKRESLGLSDSSPIARLSGNRLMDTVEQHLGVHTPMAYISDIGFGAPFGIHTEDFNLSAVSYLAAGSPKVWVVVAPRDRDKLEALMLKLVPGLRRQCHQFVRHHISYVPTRLLDLEHISYQVVLHRAGEVLVTLPGAYHQGFNTGMNVAEAVNYADSRWSIGGYECCTKRCGSTAKAFMTGASMAIREVERGCSAASRDTQTCGPDRDRKRKPWHPIAALAGTPSAKKKRAGPSSRAGPGGQYIERWKEWEEAEERFGHKQGLDLGELDKATPKPVALFMNLIKTRVPMGTSAPKTAGQYLRAEDADHITRLVTAAGGRVAINIFREVIARFRLHDLAYAAKRDEMSLSRSMEILTRLENADAFLCIARRYHLALLAQQADRILNRPDRKWTNSNRTTRARNVNERKADAYTELMNEAFPTLTRPSQTSSDGGRQESQFEWSKAYAALKKHISHGRRWQQLVKDHGLGILVLIPAINEPIHAIKDSTIYKMTDFVFDLFRTALKRKGRYLREMASGDIEAFLVAGISGELASTDAPRLVLEGQRSSDILKQPNNSLEFRRFMSVESSRHASVVDGNFGGGSEMVLFDLPR